MGCTNSTQEEHPTPSHSSSPNSAAALCYPVPFGHVPYTAALPGIMGPLTDFATGWWYYAGWAADKLGTTQFTILTQIIRDPLAPVILYGIGIKSPVSNSFFTTELIPGTSDFPSPTSSSWSISVKSPNSGAYMTCSLVTGTLGLSGATYKLDMADPNQSVALSLSLKDALGMIQEGASGSFRGEDSCSYEVAIPSLSIQEGSTISIGGNTTTL